jgi:hypothetical protein
MNMQTLIKQDKSEKLLKSALAIVNPMPSHNLNLPQI